MVKKRPAGAVGEEAQMGVRVPSSSSWGFIFGFSDRRQFAWLGSWLGYSRWGLLLGASPPPSSWVSGEEDLERRLVAEEGT